MDESITGGRAFVGCRRITARTHAGSNPRRFCRGSERHRLALFESDAMEDMIYRCAALHIDHIGSQGDPFETGASRPLDFGHWSAHKLEELTGHSINHGEAVAIGIARDSLYSFNWELISRHQFDTILTLLTDLHLLM